MELSDRYSPQEVEKRIYQKWMDEGCFKAQDLSTKPPFSVILPPPNVTGSLHLGHALDHTIQDVLVRWKRMSGFNALWLPGTDHAGIATQSVVERELRKQKINRQDLGREAFVEKVWDWKRQYGDRIVEQMKRLGDSCDWDRFAFTLDEGVSKAVRKVFVTLYKKQLIYKGQKLINWSPALESAISDLEVNYVETKGNLYHIRYPLTDGSGEVVVATTRPETMLGDVAVAVHPEDARYQSFIGKKVKLPLTNREIPILSDSFVDQAFGSGVVKITPAHDLNDYAVGERHKLPLINILNKNGTLNENGGAYQGLSVAEARKKIVAALEEQNLMLKVEPHVHQVGHCSRTDCVVEPFLSEQWFVRTQSMANAGKRVVESGTIVFKPESWTKTYLHWMNNIQDWCISRQLWWGHRIPAWVCADCNHVTVSETDPTECEKCHKKNISQDEDVLDTWFSSALWPFSTLGWPLETEAQRTFYPTSVLVTGFDIIFFWVARMIMMGLEFKKDVPFRTVYIHGVIRDASGKKMSKSTGNAEDPLTIIDQHGADALRFTLLSQLMQGRDLKFSNQRLEGYRNFMNKIWNATRFALKAFEGVSADQIRSWKPTKANLSDADQWVLQKLLETEKSVDQSLASYDFSEAASTMYSFVWNIFCDWYLEFIKPVIYGQKQEEKQATLWVLAHVMDRTMKMLHPFVPFITEELYAKLPLSEGTLMVQTYPTVRNDKDLLSFASEEAALELDLVREVITAIRNIRGELMIKPGQKIKAYLAPSEDQTQKILGENKQAIMVMAGLELCDVGVHDNRAKCAVAPVMVKQLKLDVVIPLEGLVDIEEEVKRIDKNLMKVEKELMGLKGRLSDANFAKNAPPEILEQTKLQEKDLLEKTRILQETRARLS